MSPNSRANLSRSVLEMYFCASNFLSNSLRWYLEKTVLFRGRHFGGDTQENVTPDPGGPEIPWTEGWTWWTFNGDCEGQGDNERDELVLGL